jgi:hypothetical protein
VVVEILRSSPENSQVTTKNWPFAEKSAWLGPRHPGRLTVAIGANVRGLEKRISLYCSTITIAARPFGVK